LRQSLPGLVLVYPQWPGPRGEHQKQRIGKSQLSQAHQGALQITQGRQPLPFKEHLMRMDKIKQISAELDNDPNRKFANFDEMFDVLSFRAAKGIIRLKKWQREQKRKQQR
jgi:hypothetical protein